MAQKNVQIAGATYSDVPGIEVPLANEQGNAYFVDVSDTTAVAADVASGKYFYKADGTKDVGTGSSGGTVTITDTLDSAGGTIRKITASPNATVVEALSVTQNGTYTPSANHAYAPVTVNVSGGGGGDATLAAVLGRTATSLTIPATITALGDYALYYFATLEDLTALSVVTVGENACYGCSSLETMSLPAVESIGDYAFADCALNSALSLPSVETIGNDAFYGNYELPSISLPSVLSIGDNAFRFCDALATFYAPLLETLGNNALRGCAVTSLSFPALTSVGDNAVSWCYDLTSFIAPLVESIGDSAFYGDDLLTSLSFPVLTSVGESAFDGCSSLASLNAPLLEQVGAYAFLSVAITDFVFPNLIGISEYAIPYSSDSIYIGANCEYIDPNAFGECWDHTLTINCGFGSDSPLAADAPWGAAYGVVNYNVAPPS